MDKLRRYILTDFEKDTDDGFKALEPAIWFLIIIAVLYFGGVFVHTLWGM